jgi:hypothetical protein
MPAGYPPAPAAPAPASVPMPAGLAPIDASKKS